MGPMRMIKRMMKSSTESDKYNDSSLLSYDGVPVNRILSVDSAEPISKKSARGREVAFQPFSKNSKFLARADVYRNGTNADELKYYHDVDRELEVATVNLESPWNPSNRGESTYAVNTYTAHATATSHRSPWDPRSSMQMNPSRVNDDLSRRLASKGSGLKKRGSLRLPWGSKVEQRETDETVSEEETMVSSKQHNQRPLYRKLVASAREADAHSDSTHKMEVRAVTGPARRESSADISQRHMSTFAEALRAEVGEVQLERVQTSTGDNLGRLDSIHSNVFDTVDSRLFEIDSSSDVFDDSEGFFKHVESLIVVDEELFDLGLTEQDDTFSPNSDWQTPDELSSASLTVGTTKPSAPINRSSAESLAVSEITSTNASEPPDRRSGQKRVEFNSPGADADGLSDHKERDMEQLFDLRKGRGKTLPTRADAFRGDDEGTDKAQSFRQYASRKKFRIGLRLLGHEKLPDKEKDAGIDYGHEFTAKSWRPKPKSTKLGFFDMETVRNRSNWQDELYGSKSRYHTRHQNDIPSSDVAAQRTVQQKFPPSRRSVSFTKEASNSKKGFSLYSRGISDVIATEDKLNQPASGIPYHHAVKLSSMQKLSAKISEAFGGDDSALRSATNALERNAYVQTAF